MTNPKKKSHLSMMKQVTYSQHNSALLLHTAQYVFAGVSMQIKVSSSKKILYQNFPKSCFTFNGRRSLAPLFSSDPEGHNSHSPNLFTKPEQESNMQYSVLVDGIGYISVNLLDSEGEAIGLGLSALKRKSYLESSGA